MKELDGQLKWKNYPINCKVQGRRLKVVWACSEKRRIPG